MSSSVNIDSKGYGKIYKSVMRDKKLPLLAKAIYAYFCGYAGNGYKAFPKRDKIIKDLQINKDTFTKHLNTLVEGGYIVKEREKSGNIYTIMQTVQTYENGRGNQNETMTDMLVMENVAAKGYGTVPKLVMLDSALTAQAKAIYAYFASFSGAGTTAFPRRTTVMRELGIGSTNTYYKHLDLLVKHGYLSIKQRKSEGRFDVCTYRLNCVVAPGASSQRESLPVSEKARYGKDRSNTLQSNPKEPVAMGMSEKVRHSGKVENTPNPTPEKVISEKVRHEKNVSQKTGHSSNINNISTRNSYFITEQEDNHQPRPQPMTEGRLTLISSEDVKQYIQFDHLQNEVENWGQLLKNTLGILDTPKENMRYYQVMDDIFLEITNQLTDQLNKAKEPDKLVAVIKSEAFTVMFDDILARWDEIRNVRAYIEASLSNLIARGRRG